MIAYRTEHGLSQRALAERSGIKQPAVARLEDGETTPSMATLTHVARTLGLRFPLEVGSEVSVSAHEGNDDPLTRASLLGRERRDWVPLTWSNVL